MKVNEIINLIKEEEELEGEMPEELKDIIIKACERKDVFSIAEMLRTTVRLTKENIIKRIKEEEINNALKQTRKDEIKRYSNSKLKKQIY